MDISDWSDYGAKILDFSVSEIPVSDNYFLAPKGYLPVRYTGTAGLRDVTFTLEFKGTWATCAQNASNLVADLNSGADIYLPDGFWYYCVPQQGKVPKRKMTTYMTQVFSVKAVRHGELVTETLTEDDTIDVDGNRETPVRLTIAGITADVEVMGVTISDYTGTLIIDSMAGTVTDGTDNMFLYTTFTEFPKLEPGENEIEVPSGVTSLTIEYYPLWW